MRDIRRCRVGLPAHVASTAAWRAGEGPGSGGAHWRAGPGSDTATGEWPKTARDGGVCYVQLLLIRHAIAEDRLSSDASGASDAARPLTARCRRRMQRASAALVVMLPAMDLLVSSPLVRARETADIIAFEYPNVRRHVSCELAPAGRREELAAWLDAQGVETAALVGHEPDLGDLASWLLADRAPGFISFKKGGACLLECRRPTGPASASLRWLLTARQLRVLSEAAP